MRIAGTIGLVLVVLLLVAVVAFRYIERNWDEERAQAIIHLKDAVVDDEGNVNTPPPAAYSAPPVSIPYEPNEDVPAADTWKLSSCAISGIGFNYPTLVGPLESMHDGSENYRYVNSWYNSACDHGKAEVVCTAGFEGIMPCPNYDAQVGNVSYPPSFFAGRSVRLYVPYHERDAGFRSNIQYMCKAGYRFYQLPHPIPDYEGEDTDELVCRKSIPVTQLANIVPRVPVSNPYEPNQDVPAADTWRLSPCVKGDFKIEPDDGFLAGRITSVEVTGQTYRINGPRQVIPMCQDGWITIALYGAGVGIHAVDVKEPPSAFSSRSMRLYVDLPENHDNEYRAFIQYACKAGYRIYRMPNQMPDYDGADTDELLCGNAGSLYRGR